METSSNRAGLAYMLLVVAFMALVLFSNHPSHPKSRKNRRFMPGRRLKLRSGPVDSSKRHDRVAFDPVVAEYERRREDRAWEKQYFEQRYKEWGENGHQKPDSQPLVDPVHHQPTDKVVEPEPQPLPWEEDPDYDDPEDFLNDEDQFNITDRLTVLFPQLDSNPRDGFVSITELRDWHWQQGVKATQHRTDREMEMHDTNHDGLITFKEYLPNLSEEELEKNSMDHGGAGWWKEQFLICDEDKDALNRTEFNNFLHPEDSDNPKLRKWLREEQIRLRDSNNDGKLNLQEFHNSVFDVIRDYEVEDGMAESDHLHPVRDVESKKQTLSKARFTELDTNQDGVLTEEEIEPILKKLHPGEAFYAKQQAEHLMSQADENKDKRLTLEEMLNHPYVFYSTAYDHEESDYFHDEFR